MFTYLVIIVHSKSTAPSLKIIDRDHLLLTAICWSKHQLKLPSLVHHKVSRTVLFQVGNRIEKGKIDGKSRFKSLSPRCWSQKINDMSVYLMNIDNH